MRVDIGIANRLGDRRSNQDRFATCQRGDAIIMVLADGMGGHPCGELAAEITTQTLIRQFEQVVLPLAIPARFLRHSLLLAHQTVVRAGLNKWPPVQPRTTCVACITQNNQVWWSHVGDSRFYLLRKQQVIERTRDHSRVEFLREQGLITNQEVNHHPDLNILTQSIGGQPTPPVISQGHASLQQNDSLLLCSDGLWNALHEREILAILSRHPPGTAADLLADAAAAARYPNSDNITLLTLRWPAPGDPSGHPTTGESRPVSHHDSQLDRAIRLLQDTLDEYEDERGQD